jgi:hypothetical protein
VTISKQFPVYDPLAVLTDRLRAELVSYGVIAGDRVEYGPAKDMRQDDAPRVWVDLSPRFTVGKPGAGGSNPGYGLETEMPDDDEQPAEVVARSLWTVSDGVRITILGQVPESGEEASELRGDAPALLSRLSVHELRARVLQGLYHVLKIGASQIQGEWRRPEDHEFQYGAACDLLFSIATEVPDSPQHIVRPNAEIDVIAKLPAGEYLAATLNLVPSSG